MAKIKSLKIIAPPSQLIKARHSMPDFEVKIAPNNADKTKVKWYSENEDTLIINENLGSCYAFKSGKVVVRAETTDGSELVARKEITVLPSNYVEKIEIIPSSLKILNGGVSVEPFTAVCSPANAENKIVEWKSSNTNVAKVDKITGEVYGKGVGKVDIIACAMDGGGVVGSCTIEVVNDIYIQSLKIREKNVVLSLNQQKQLAVKIVPASSDGCPLKWTSENPKIVKVEKSTGKVTAVSVGQTYIKVEAADGSQISDRIPIWVEHTTKISIPDDGKNYSDKDFVVDPIETYSGSHTIENSVMRLFGGKNLDLKLLYNSSKLVNGVFGVGWYHNFEKHIEVGDNEIFVYSSPSTYVAYTTNDGINYICDTPSKRGYELTYDPNRQYPFILNCNKENIEFYNLDGTLGRIDDKHTFATIIEYSDDLISISDSVTAQKICLEKDSTGKIVKIYDENSREVSINYIEIGEENYISSIINVNGYVLTYTYDEKGKIISGTDNNNICFFRNTYDELGRVISQKDGIQDSSPTFFEYDEDKRVITNREGKKSIRYYNESGLLISSVDENQKSNFFVYDDYNNVVEEIDKSGNSIIKTYDENNRVIKIVDKNGESTEYEYNNDGNIIRITYPSINSVSVEEVFTYNDCWKKVASHIDKRGTVTSYTYDENGMLATKKVGDKPAETFLYEKGLLLRYTNSRGFSTRYAYNGFGLKVLELDDAGNEIKYEYDSNGNLLKKIDAAGNSVVYTYDCNDQKISVTDSNGNVTRYIYNENLKKVQTTLPDNNVIIYNYDAEDRLADTIDQLGNVSTNIYDDGGRLVIKQYLDGNKVEYQYDADGNVLKEINQKGGTISKTYDANGNVLTITDEDNNIEEFVYDQYNRVKQKISTMGGITTYTYSVGGDLLSETDSLGNTKSYTYDAYGNRLTETDARGNTTTYTYDANNNLTTVTDALNNTTTYAYDYLDRLISITDAKNHTITYGYDMAGRRNTITDAKGNVFTTYYDANGNVIKTTDAKGKTISETVYNNLNLPETVTDGAGNITSYLYNALGKVMVQTNPLGDTRQFTYNALGMNTGVKDYLGNNSGVEYDSLGNVTGMTGPMSAVTSYTYDKYGKLLSQSTPSGGIVEYTYNAQKLKDSVTNGRGQKKKYKYDILGRIIEIASFDNVTNYIYDANGNILTVSDKNGTITRQYDALNRVVYCQSANGYNTRYEYDEVGNLSAVQYYHAVKVRYTYDENNNLSTVTDWNGRVTSYSYDVNNNLIGVINANGTTTTKVYDDMQRLVSSVDRKADNTIICGFEYTYDQLGQISTEKNLATNQTICYTYDKLSRLIKREVKNSSDEIISTQSFAYDAAGNIISAPTGTFQYDTQNKLTTYNGCNVEYDLDGNMLTMPADGIPEEYAQVFYDSSNRLLNAMGSTYTYDAENNRIRSENIYFGFDYVYNTNCKLSQVLAAIENGSPIFYIYGLGLIGEEENGQFYTYHYDYRGSTLAMTDQNGNIVVTAEYDVYGMMINSDGSRRILFGYNGRDGVQTDANGLLYMRARYYCPNRRRFVNADIIHGNINDSTSLNRYAYVNGNPVSLVDPFGLSAERGVIDDYNNLIIKALQKTNQDMGKNNKYKSIINDIIKSIEAGEDVLDLPDGVQIKVKIQPNYNTAFDELMEELVGLVPIVGDGLLLYDLATSETIDGKDIFDIIKSAVGNGSLSDIKGLQKYLKPLGKIVTAIDLLAIGETLLFWDSPDKLGTRVSVFVEDDKRFSHSYQAVVDKDMCFKFKYSGYIGDTIGSNEKDFQVVLG